VGKLAGVACAAITGLPVSAALRASGPAAEPDEPVPLAAEDLSADLLPRPEDALPLLDAGAAAAWWAEHRSRFERGRRYLNGAPWGRESVLVALAHGPMRRRHALALELAVRTRGRASVETRALTARQRAEVAAAAAMPATEFERPPGG
jgi:uncharacterized protein (TIGR02270 family)